MRVQVKRGTWGNALSGFPPLVVTVLVPVVFIALKVASVVDWSWGWVLAPVWIPVLLAVAIAVLVAAAFTLVKWLLVALAWLRFRKAVAPELALADPAVLSRIEAERPPARTAETTDA
jgi:hypothetical protein